MAYSVMVWLVNPGEYPQQELEETRAADPEEAPGAATGSNIGHSLPRMAYGVYESQEEAGQALNEISNSLQSNEPLKISAQSNRVWLIPAQRVHYVVCEEVERPID